MRIRTPILAVAMIFSLGSAEEEQTLLRSGRIRSGGYGGMMVKLSPVNEELGVLVGGKGGWIINSVFSIGGAGYGLSNRVAADHPDSVRLDLGIGGVILEAAFRPARLVHATASLLIGAGGLNAHDGRMDMEDRFDNPRDGHGETFFALEPEVGLEINIVRYFRVCPSLSYRWLSGDVKLVDSDWDLSGPGAGLVLKFGKF